MFGLGLVGTVLGGSEEEGTEGAGRISRGGDHRGSRREEGVDGGGPYYYS